jgi:enterochelin esterase family protein
MVSLQRKSKFARKAGHLPLVTFDRALGITVDAPKALTNFHQNPGPRMSAPAYRPSVRLHVAALDTPPQYDAEPNRRFPVLYLRHGSGDTEENWSGTGRAGVIVDNLIAQRQAAPMIEKTYRVAPGRENRAISGLSMGGGQAFTIGLKHLDQFAWVGEFSSGLVSDSEFRIDQHLPGFLDHTDDVNQKLKLLFLSCGTEDPRYPGQLDLLDVLKQHQIKYVWFPTPGVHEWKAWRHALAEFAQKVFQPAV